ncbi:AsmA family protein [Methyloceanibacter sp.]|uniref:AsmA family protein n=1 Tax=Methyloceanibacter sp. TaxID=1965321 RepID=UPI003D6C7FEB
MNSFLLALTAVLIVVLSVLFAAPVFIDWNDYRPVFETQASKLLGRDVKVGGKVHMVLLPAPELRFDQVKVADEKGAFDQPLLEAKSIEAWLNIGALMRGAIEARKIAITEPVLRLALREDGTGNWNDVGRAGETLPFVPKEVLLDQVSVSFGRVEVSRPGMPPLVVDNVSGEASAASLSGPYKLTATYDYAGRPQELRFSTGASDADGLFRLKSVLRDPDRNTTYLLEGDVAGLRDKPSYDGAVIMRIASALPAEGPAAQQSQAQKPAEAPADGVPQSAEQATGAEANLSAFELKGELKATPDHAELPAFEIAIHSKGRSQMMKGKLALDFGAHAKAVGELAASWIDVDTLLAAAAPADAQAGPSTADALNAVAERALEQAASVGDGALTVKLDQASIGGDLVGAVDVAVAAKDGVVVIERLNAELPGENRIEASGRLTRGEAGPVFEGPIKLEGSKLRTLARWAAGDREMSGQATVGAFTLSAKTTIGAGNLMLEDASGELSGTKFSGSLRYRGGEQRILDLTLDSDRLDLREVMGESAAWRNWLPDSDAKQPDFSPVSERSLLEALRDDEVHATLRVGELLLPNIPAGRLDAKFGLAKDTLDVERLDFAAPGAVALNGNGRIEHLSDAPAGQVDLSLQAMTADGLKVTSELLGLGDGVTKSKQLASLAPLDLHMGLTSVREGDATSASIEVKGKAGGTDVSILAKATGDPGKLADAAIEIDSGVEGNEPQILLGFLVPGLAPERLAVAGADRGRFTLKAQGVPSKGITGHGELATADLQIAFDGQGSLQPEGVALAGQASAKSTNAGLALVLLGLDASPSADVPLDLRADVVKTAGSVDFKSISGEIAGEPVEGSAHFDTNGDRTRFRVAADAGTVSLPALLGSLIAWQRTPSTEEMLGSLAQNASQVWPARGFALEPLVNAEGEIALSAKELGLGAPFQVEDATLIAHVDHKGLSVTDLQGRLFDGSFAASGTLTPKGAGAELKLHAELASGRLDQLSQSLAGRVLAKGPFTFVIDVSGEGLSPPGLVAGLNGEGALFLDPGALQALSPEPLKRVAAEANRSKRIKLDKDQIAARMSTVQDTLTRGTYPYTATALPFAIKNGTLKLDPAVLAGKGAETTINGYVELASLRLDSEWALRLNGSNDADMPSVNLVLAGSLQDPGAITSVVDTEPMENFLTVRRMQADVERLETLDVSGRNQPEADAEPDAAEADASDDSGEPTAQATTEELAAKKAAVEQRAADRAAEVKRMASEKAAEEKRAAEKVAEEQRAAEKAAADKLAAEKAAEEKRAAEKATAGKLAAEKAAEEKRAAEKAAKEKLAAEKAAEKKRAAEKAAADKLAAEKAAAEKRAVEKAAAEKRAAEKVAAEKAAAEKRAAEKAAAEKLAAEKAAAEKEAADKLAAEKAAAEKEAADKLAAEKAAAEKAAADKLAEEKAAAEKAAAEKLAAEKTAAEKEAAEKRAAEKVAADKLAAEKAAAEKAAADKLAEEKAAAEKLAAEKAAAEKEAAEKLAAEKVAAERAAAAKAAASTPTPRAADLEANGAAQGNVPSPGQSEQLPWSQGATAPVPPSQSTAPSAEPQPTPAAAADDAIPAPAPVAPRKRPNRPRPAPDDWKKGISIFGGG